MAANKSTAIFWVVGGTLLLVIVIAVVVVATQKKDNTAVAPAPQPQQPGSGLFGLLQGLFQGNNDNISTYVPGGLSLQDQLALSNPYMG